MLSLKTHNVLDYVGGVLLLATPYLLGFNDVEVARNVFLVLGLGLIGYSLITNYYYSVLKIIPVRVHMVLDVMAGAVLILAPYLFGYRDLIAGGQIGAHFALGLGVFALVGFTRDKSVTRVDIRRDETESYKRAA